MNQKFVAYLTGVLLGCLILFVLPRPFSINQDTVREGIRMSEDSRDGGYPKTLTDSLGREVYFPLAPQRIVSLAPSITESMIALGQQEKIIARTDWDRTREDILALPSVGRMDTPSRETLLTLQSDTILLTDLTPVDTVRQLERLNIPVFVMSFSSLEDTLKAMELIGDITVARERTEAVVGEIRQRMEENISSMADESKPKVLLLYDAVELYSAGKDSWVGELIEIAGGENLAAGAPTAWPRLSAEYVLTAQPEVLLIIQRPSDRDDKEAETLKHVAESPLFANSPAVRQGRVHFIDSRPFTIPGPGILTALDILQEKISP